MAQEPAELRRLIAPTVESMGFELVGVEFKGGQHALLRLYIDAEDGVSVDDCALVSHQVSGLLDVEDPIPGQYDLEVSSPGLDRPLFRAEDYARFAGQRVRVRTDVPVLGRRNFSGLLQGLEGDQVIVEVDGEAYALPLDQIEQARLVPEY
jgi:ribosome maturation factor RimP